MGSPPDPWIGRRLLGKYQVEARLGAGGMGAVYQANQLNLGRPVAVKIINAPPDAESDAHTRQRFEREARTVARLRHPYIIQIYDWGVDDLTGQSVIIMQFAEGKSLLNLLERRFHGQPMPLDQAARCFQEISSALQHAHRQGILHRDLKPGNVLLDGNGHCLLADFGLAKWIGGSPLTHTDQLLGTPAYLAPEVALGQEASEASDQYALGVLLYQCLTGRLPFDQADHLQVLAQHIHAAPLNPVSRNTDLPAAAGAVLLQSLAKAPDARFGSVLEFCNAFLAALPAAFAVSGTLPAAAPPAAVPTWRPETATSDDALSTAPLPLARSPVQSLSFLESYRSDFVGRQAELEAVARQLDEQRFVLITGMPGVGKSALAAQVAWRLRPDHQIVAYRVLPTDGLRSILANVARRLADLGQAELLHYLSGKSVQDTGYTDAALLDYAIHALQGRRLLLCLDDMQFVRAEPLLEAFFERLRTVCQLGELHVLWVSQQVFPFLPRPFLYPLAGLSLEDVQALFADQVADVPRHLVAMVQQRLGGNAYLIHLAGELLGQDDLARPEQVLQRILESDELNHFLVKEVDEGLSEAERQVLQALSLTQGAPVSRRALAAILDAPFPARPMSRLLERNLVQSGFSGAAQHYAVHQLLAEFYASDLAPAERVARQQRAAQFYERVEPLPLLAARLYHAAGDREHAIRVVSRQVWPIINAGQARSLVEFLSDLLTLAGLPALDQAAALWAQGLAQLVLGGQDAGRSFELARQALEPAPASPAARRLHIHLCQAMAEHLQDDDPWRAVEWLHQGLELVEADAGELEAALRIRLGRILASHGQKSAAEPELQRGLELLGPGPSRGRFSALLNLGNIFCTRGDLDRGLDHYQRAAAVAAALDDAWALAEAWLNLGIEHNIAAHWPEALTYYRRAEQQARVLGSTPQLTRAHLSQGNVYTKQGNSEAALQHLHVALALAQQAGLQADQAFILVSVANAHCCAEQFEAAQAVLAQARPMIEATDARETWPEFYRCEALAALAGEAWTQALTAAEHALASARTIEDQQEEGLSWRVLGLAQSKNGQPAAAAAAFQQSLNLLAGRDPYETARTKLALAQALVSEAQPARAAPYLADAAAEFERIGAHHDLNQASHLSGQV